MLCELNLNTAVGKGAPHDLKGVGGHNLCLPPPPLDPVLRFHAFLLGWGSPFLPSFSVGKLPMGTASGAPASPPPLKLQLVEYWGLRIPRLSLRFLR